MHKEMFNKNIEMDEANAVIMVSDYGISLTIGSEYEGEITIALDVENIDKLIEGLKEAREVYAN